MRVFGDVMWRWGQNNPVFRAFYLMLDELPQIVTCVALIVCGLWLVRGPKGKKVHRKKAENRRTRTSASTPQPKPMHRKPRRKPQTLPCRSSALCWATR